MEKSGGKGEENLTTIKLKETFPDSVLLAHSFRGDETVIVRREDITKICKFLKEDLDLSFNMLTDLTAVDYLPNPFTGKVRPCPVPPFQPVTPETLEGIGGIPEQRSPAKERFEVVYHLYSLERNKRLRIKAPVPETDASIDSVVSVWAGANWMERMVYDLYGIVFKGHPDLRRIYLYPEFQGYPLRKDYPKEKRQPLIGPED